MIQNLPDLYKIFARFSQPKSFNIVRIFDEYERLHAFGSHAQHSRPSFIGYTISRLRLVNSIYIYIYIVENGLLTLKSARYLGR